MSAIWENRNAIVQSLFYVTKHMGTCSDALPLGGPGHGTLRRTRAGKQAGKAGRSQGHPHARVM